VQIANSEHGYDKDDIEDGLDPAQQEGDAFDPLLVPFQLPFVQASLSSAHGYLGLGPSLVVFDFVFERMSPGLQEHLEKWQHQTYKHPGGDKAKPVLLPEAGGYLNQHGDQDKEDCEVNSDSCIKQVIREVVGWMTNYYSYHSGDSCSNKESIWIPA